MDENLKRNIELENSRDIDLYLRKHKFKPISVEKSKPKEKKINYSSKITDQQPSLVVKKSPIHGYGVFTQSLINQNSIIEICYIIELEFRDKYHKDRVILDYCYTTSLKDNDSIKHGNRLILLTGNGMLYNHRENNNAEWTFDYNERKAILISKTNLNIDDEITINYGDGYWKRHDNRY